MRPGTLAEGPALIDPVAQRSRQRRSGGEIGVDKSAIGLTL
jgi:hypothetical protein